MPDKLVNIGFIGGDNDGEVLENFPVNKLPPRFYFPSDIYFADDKSGGMNIYKGKLNTYWHSYSACCYVRKTENNKPVSIVKYEFSENIMIDRCSALTNKKLRCMKPAIYGKTHCSTHTKKT